MRQYLLPENGQFYKTNLHCHTTVSDGRLTPEEVKQAYKQKGYSAVCFTDHEVLIPHEELCDRDFIALHGYETAVKKYPKEHTGNFNPAYHFNLIAKRQDTRNMVCFYPENVTVGNSPNYLPFVTYIGEPCTYEYDFAFINHLIAEANSHGFLVNYNHPRWSLHTGEDYLGLKGLAGVEVQNTGCEDMGDFSNSLVYEDMLRSGMRLLPVATDDNHNTGKNMWEDSFGGFTMIKAPELSYDALIDAYLRGDMYASAGPLINDLYIEDGSLFVHTSPSARIVLRGEGRYTKVRRCAEFHRTEGAFSLPFSEIGRYFRIEVVDVHGRKALTRAYFREEIQGM